MSNEDATTFIVYVDWVEKTVSARLTSNPQHLFGADLEKSLQMAVYYGSAVSCRMKESGRQHKEGRPHEIVGKLQCSWFDSTQRPAG